MSNQDNTKIAVAAGGEAAEVRRCADGCHWASHHAANATIWVNICTLCGTIDGDDLNAQVDEKLTALREQLEAEHPEARCRRCHIPNTNDWSAPSPLWNEVMRGGDINGVELFSGIVCPTCFMILAQEAGIASSWRLYAEDVHRPLQTVTPSGRVWNEQTWRFDTSVTRLDPGGAS
jgi:hypothetical protein